jgi:integrase
LILTAARTGEVLSARRSEIDLNQRVWTIPAERMKAGREHRVPLSSRAVEILEQTLTLADDKQLVFPSSRPGRPLGGMVFFTMLKRMDLHTTAHGFRSSFRDWCAERTNFPREVAEMALAHSITDKTEAAYRRGDLFEKRRQLMNEWAAYATSRCSAGSRSRH